jgi:hypothetical protein
VVLRPRSAPVVVMAEPVGATQFGSASETSLNKFAGPSLLRSNFKRQSHAIPGYWPKELVRQVEFIPEHVGRTVRARPSGIRPDRRQPTSKLIPTPKSRERLRLTPQLLGRLTEVRAPPCCWSLAAAAPIVSVHPRSPYNGHRFATKKIRGLGDKGRTSGGCEIHVGLC